MPIGGTEYFERIRSNKNFLSSLFFGILAGGIFSLLLGQLLTLPFPNLHWGICLASFLIVSFGAYTFSQRSEEVISSIVASIDSSCFESLFKTFEGSIENLEDGNVKDLLKTLRNCFGNDLMLDASDIKSLQRFERELNKAIPGERGGAILQLLQQLRSMLTTIENIVQEATRVAANKATFYNQLGYEAVPKENSTLSINKSVWLGLRKMEVISFKFDSNLNYSLLEPIRCEIRMYPFLKFSEFSFLAKSIEKFLSDIANEKEFLELGLSFNIPTTENYWKRTVDQISQSIKSEFEDLSATLSKVSRFITKE